MICDEMNRYDVMETASPNANVQKLPYSTPRKASPPNTAVTGKANAVATDLSPSRIATPLEANCGA